MTTEELASLSIDDLWKLHEEVVHLLSARIVEEKAQLERRLAQLAAGKRVFPGATSAAKSSPSRKPRRKYPPVVAKYQNPSVPNETWSGRGRQPRWLVAALKSGRKIEDFSILRRK
jgi:DNA-binding protein H-NS